MLNLGKEAGRLAFMQSVVALAFQRVTDFLLSSQIHERYAVKNLKIGEEN